MKLAELHKHLGESFPLAEARQQLWHRDTEQLPWIGRVLMGVGGWLSAIFLMGFLAMLFFNLLGFDESFALVVGCLIVGTSIWVSRLSNHPFVSQVVIAFSSAGILLTIFGASNTFNNEELFGLICSAILALVIYLFGKNSLQKSSGILAVFITYIVFHGQIFSNQVMHPLAFVIGSGLLAILLSGTFAKSDYFRPAVYGLISGLYLLYWMDSIGTWRQQASGFEELVLSHLPGIFLLGAIVKLTHPKTTQGWLAILLGAILLTGISYFGGGGIALSLGIILCGHARREPVLQWVGIAGLVVFSILFYYFLGVSLLNKSWLLIGSGVVLLLISTAVHFLPTNLKPTQTHE